MIILLKKYYLKSIIIIKNIEILIKLFIIYNNCYKKYFPNLYLELLGVYSLSDLTKMIYRKIIIIKLLKEKKVKLENYREEAKNILSIENIKIILYVLMKNI